MLLLLTSCPSCSSYSHKLNALRSRAEKPLAIAIPSELVPEPRKDVTKSVDGAGLPLRLDSRNGFRIVYA
jgi:hypothetical protein